MPIGVLSSYCSTLNRFDTKRSGLPTYMHLDRHRQTPANTYTDGSPYVMSCSVPRVYILLKFGDFIKM